MQSAKSFAREAMRNGLRLAPTGSMRITSDWTELILSREGQRQIELIVLSPGAQVPRHKHTRCESADLCLGGGGSFEVDALRFDFMGHHVVGRRLFSVPRHAPHGGHAGPQGAAYLSFQIWHGEPGFIADDWQPCQ